MKKIIITAFLGSVILSLSQAQSEKFLAFKYKPDDNYRILSTVNETVKVNGRLNHNAEIVNRVAVKLTKVGEGMNRLCPRCGISS